MLDEALKMVKPKYLSETEKRWLTARFETCRLQHPEEAVDVDRFIASAIRFKQEVSIRHFSALFSKPADREHARLAYYIGLCETFYAAKDKLDSMAWLMSLTSDRWTQCQWGELLRSLKLVHNIHVEEAYPEFPKYGLVKDTKKTRLAFETRSEFVQYPLSSQELDTIDNHYRIMAGFESGLLQVSRAELKTMFAAHRAVMNSAPEHPDHQLKLLALIRHAIRLVYGKYAYVTQVFALLGLLLNPKGRIAQVRTGEGKTTIFMMLIALLASQNKRVHWVTSSEDLAKRDYHEAKPLFELLGLSIECVSEKRDTPFTASILVGTNCDFEFLVLNDAFKLPESAQLSLEHAVAVVDEVDNLLIDTAGNAAHLAEPAAHPKTWIYAPLVEFVRQTGPHQVTAFRAALLKAHYSEVKKMSDEELAQLLNQAEQAVYKLHRKQHYDVDGTEIIILDKDNTGTAQKGMRWGGGLHECVEVKEGLTPQVESVTRASISHPTYFKRHYTAMYGLTGTMGSLEEREEVCQTYGIDTFDVPHHVPSRRKVLPLSLSANQDEQWQAILIEIKRMQALRHPILLLFETVEATEAFDVLLRQEGFKPQVINDRQPGDKDYIIAQAGQLRMITIATNIASRGTDIKLHGPFHPGLALITTFYPKNIRVEEQMLGRVARKGEPGCCRMMLCGEANADLRTARVKRDSILRMFRVAQDECWYDVFLLFRTLYQQHLTRLNALGMDPLIARCRDQLNEPRVIHLLPEGLAKLATFAQTLIQQSQAGIEVDWRLFIKAFQEAYNKHLIQRWAEFYTELMTRNDLTRADALAEFYEFMQQELKPYLASTDQVSTWMLRVLGAPIVDAKHVFDPVFLDCERQLKGNIQAGNRYYFWSQDEKDAGEVASLGLCSGV